jgi:hypothetical protein
MAFRGDVTMRSRQAGITFIGWLFLLVPIAIVGYAGIRLAPIYLNYLKVSKSLTQTAAEFKGDEQLNVVAVRSALQRRFDIDSLDFPKVSDIDVSREGKQWQLRAAYEDSVRLFGGISMLVQFDKLVPIE